MTNEIYSAAERSLLEAWFSGRSLTLEEEALLGEEGFENDCEPYTRLDAWVGAFAVSELQGRLPNWTLVKADGRFLQAREIRPTRSRKVTGIVRPLLDINWADSGPGFSWPVSYCLVWLPEFEQFAVTASADSPDMFGYCDFALGHFGAERDWRERVREILVGDWRRQWNEYGQAPWVELLGTGLVKRQEALAWREEAWEGHEDFAADCEDPEEDGDEDADASSATDGRELADGTAPVVNPAVCRGTWT